MFITLHDHRLNEFVVYLFRVFLFRYDYR